MIALLTTAGMKWPPSVFRMCKRGSRSQSSAYQLDYRSATLWPRTKVYIHGAEHVSMPYHEYVEWRYLFSYPCIKGCSLDVFDPSMEPRMGQDL